MAGSIATYAVPFDVFFPDADPALGRVPANLVRDLYMPTAQWEEVFDTLTRAAAILNGSHTRRTIAMHDALARLFVALLPFSFDRESNVLEPTYYGGAYRDWCDTLTVLDPLMGAWYQRWLDSMDLQEWDDFSYNLAANTVKFVHHLNSGLLVYKGTARGLNDLGRLSTTKKYLMADLLEDFTHAYVELLDLVGK